MLASFSQSFCLWDPSVLWVIVDYPFSLLYKVILCDYTMIYLPIWLLISIWVVSSFELLWIELLWTLLCMSFGDSIYAFLSFFFGPRIFSFKNFRCFFIYHCWSKNRHILNLLHFSGIIHFRADLHFISFFKETFIYLAVSSLNCGNTGSFIAVYRLSVVDSRTGGFLWLKPRKLSCHAAWDLSSLMRDWTHVLLHWKAILNHWTTKKSQHFIS